MKFTNFYFATDDYAKKLFHKKCFADQDHFSAQDSFEIIPKKYLARRNHNIKFRAFKPIIKLQSDKFEWYDKVWNFFKNDEKRISKQIKHATGKNDLTFKHKMYNYIEFFNIDLGKSPLALRVVPLLVFTIKKI